MMRYVCIISIHTAKHFSCRFTRHQKARLQVNDQRNEKYQALGNVSPMIRIPVCRVEIRYETPTIVTGITLTGNTARLELMRPTFDIFQSRLRSADVPVCRHYLLKILQNNY